MSDTSSSSSSGGIGFAGLLTIVFITLKLLGKIDWSWWWVLSPLWLAPLVAIAALGMFGLLVVGVYAAGEIGESISRRKRIRRQVLSLKPSPAPARETRDNNRTKDGSWLH